VLLVNLLAALNFANVFFKFKKNVWKMKKKTFKNVNNVTKINKKREKKNVFTTCTRIVTNLAWQWSVFTGCVHKPARGATGRS